MTGNTRKTEGRFSISLPPELLDYKPVKVPLRSYAIIGHGESSIRSCSMSANWYFSRCTCSISNTCTSVLHNYIYST